MRETLTRLLAVGTLVTLSCSMGCGGSSSEVKHCADLTCGVHQVCQEASSSKSAKCIEECDAGFVWNSATSVCDPAGATCTELDCAGQGRACINNPTGAQCGDTCLSGWRLVGTDCVEMTSCEPMPAEGRSILNECGGIGRVCDEAVAGEAECGDCMLASHVVDPDTGACRNPLTCGDITCTDPPICNTYPGRDAFCDYTCQGPNGEPGLVNSSGVCKLCPPCDNIAPGPLEGEAGPFLGGLTGADHCICETLPGYYWQEGTPTGVTPCDADGDGWVRFNAKAALESGSAVVSGRAHCDFREIETVMLHNEQGESLAIPVSPTVLMFESNRNDDQALLTEALNSGATHIAELSPGRRPKPEELNSLTKYCVTTFGDFNQNKIEDVDEWHGSTATVDPEHQGLLDFTYYAELHRGWFEFTTAPRGIYHIEEKSRAALAEAGWKVPFVRQGTKNYWRTCTRKRDKEYTNSARVDNYQNMDFAAYDKATTEFSGMTHHSQFKCHKILTSVAGDAPPHHVTAAMLNDPVDCPTSLGGAERAACLPRVNSCTALDTTSGPEPGWNAFNPSSADMSCTALVASPSAPAIRWVTYGYYDYPVRIGPTPPYPRELYLRGCVSECEETESSCPGCAQTGEGCPGTSLPGATCEDDVADYGVRQCGCGTKWGSVDCDWVCPAETVLLEADFQIAPRQSQYWLCGRFTYGTYVETLDYSMYEDLSSGYRLYSEMFLTRPAGGRLCQAVDCSSGYILK